MPPRTQPACVTTAPDDAAVLVSILFGSEEGKKSDARQQVSKITVLWQHWLPSLKSAIRADIETLLPEGKDTAPALAAGYSESLTMTVLRDLGRL